MKRYEINVDENKSPTKQTHNKTTRPQDLKHLKCDYFPKSSSFAQQVKSIQTHFFFPGLSFTRLWMLLRFSRWKSQGRVPANGAKVRMGGTPCFLGNTGSASTSWFRMVEVMWLSSDGKLTGLLSTGWKTKTCIRKHTSKTTWWKCTYRHVTYCDCKKNLDTFLGSLYEMSSILPLHTTDLLPVIWSTLFFNVKAGYFLWICETSDSISHYRQVTRRITKCGNNNSVCATNQCVKIW